MSESNRVQEFDVWRPGYAGATITVYQAGTTTPASIYSNADLTGALANPQTLLSQTVDDIAFGKFQQSVYVGSPYQLLINSTELTGVEALPITTLVGADVSMSVAQSARGTVTRTIEDWLDDAIHVEAFGVLGANATTNTTIITTAIGVAAAQGGGQVLMPSGTYDFNTLSLPQAVILRGQGQRTTILQSTQGENVITLAGSYAGLRDIQIDGEVQTPASVGVYAVGKSGLVLQNVIIDGFAKGIEYRGAQAPIFDNVDVTNCIGGADLRGDSDAGGSAAGTNLQGLLWLGGRIWANTDYGLRLAVEDETVERVDLRNIRFDLNVGPALKIEGAEMLNVVQCRFVNNTANLDVADGADADTTPTARLTFDQVLFQAGTIILAGTCEKVMFRTTDFNGADITFSAPENNILFLDCIERANTTSIGNTERLTRTSGFKVQETFGVTTDATATPAWETALEPGEHIRATARVIGKGRSGANTASYEFAGAAYRESSTVTFDTASGTLVEGLQMTGALSGATARAVVITQVLAAGTLAIREIDGDFQNGETVTFSDSETCVLTGPVVPGVAVLAGSVEQRTPTIETNAAWAATFDVDSVNFRVVVTGEAGLTVEWSVEVNSFRA